MTGRPARRHAPCVPTPCATGPAILEAAENVFAVEGIEVPVDLIAEKAGVGVGTLYRHFPTKEKLCEAVLLDRLSALTLTPRRWRTPTTRRPPSSTS